MLGREGDSGGAGARGRFRGCWGEREIQGVLGREGDSGGAGARGRFRGCWGEREDSGVAGVRGSGIESKFSKEGEGALVYYCHF